MGRPKKSSSDQLPTRERILRQATELFAGHAYEAVSVRDITGSLGLNEASLYNHYQSKAALFDTILKRLGERFLNPAFAPIPAELFEKEGPFDLERFLVDGARQFFSKADEETVLTWRILMINQYRYDAARRTLVNGILDAPVRFFEDALEKLRERDKIRRDADCETAARLIASVFFEYSFRSNLARAWDQSSDEEFQRLRPQLRLIAAALAPVEAAAGTASSSKPEDHSNGTR